MPLRFGGKISPDFAVFPPYGGKINTPGQEMSEVDEMLVRTKLETAEAMRKVELGEAEFKTKQEQFYHTIQV